MATPSRIREVAFHLLFQLDAQGACDVPEPADDGELLTTGERAKAEALANGAFEHRAAADEAMERFAPGWPAHRQPAVDRAILRLAYHEMVALDVPAAIAINDAVELSKRYISTERSPAFINALLDRVNKEIVGEKDGAEGERAPSVIVEDSNDTSPARAGEEAGDTARRAVPRGDEEVGDTARRAVPRGDEEAGDMARRAVPPGDEA